MYTVSSSSTKNLLLLSSTPSSATTTTPKLIPTIKIPFLSKPMISISNSNSNHHLRRNLVVLVVYSKPSSSSSEGAESLSSIDEWLERLPEKDMSLYSHSLPCIEAWLRKLGFHQSKEDRSVWFVEKVDWHAQLSLDVTDLNIRYLKRGPGDLGKDVERRFSYALSREDIENAILGGP